MPFAYEAVDSTGSEVNAVIDADSSDDAMRQLHARGLFVTQVSEVGDAEPRPASQSVKLSAVLPGRAGTTRDRLLLTQQMSMMLNAGSQVVPALTAIQSQIDKPAWRDVVQDVCQKVQHGTSLSDAMAEHPRIFDETFRAIVAAGESTGSTAQAFDRLALMTKLQRQISVRVVGALIYPALLVLMAVGVVSTLMFYVLPKFDDLYKTLGTQLPTITVVMVSMSRWIMDHQIAVAAIAFGVVLCPVIALRLTSGRVLVDSLATGLPIISRTIRRVILAKIFRVWGTLVQSNVPLLDALRIARDSVRNARFLAMLDDVIRSVAEGNSVGDSLARHTLVPTTMSSAIATGEQSGRLGESLVFLADYLDEENAEAITTMTRLLEPLILIVMGFLVGGIAIALFLPLFDLTSATAGH